MGSISVPDAPKATFCPIYSLKTGYLSALTTVINGVVIMMLTIVCTDHACLLF